MTNDIPSNFVQIVMAIRLPRVVLAFLVGASLAMADLKGPWARGLDDTAAATTPPKDTRARVRSALMREIADKPGAYEIDWHRLEYGAGESVLLLDPFQARPK